MPDTTPGPQSEAGPLSTISILNRWSGSVQFQCELSAEVSARRFGLRLGFAIKAAFSAGADLRGADLSDADLSDAVLSGAVLSGADGLPDAPVVPNIDAAILAAVEAGGTLRMSSWHTCGTSHCRGGWAVHLAGDAGYALERKFGTNVAATLIYAASRPGVPVPSFSAAADNDETLADIRACAAAQTSGEARS